jgi:hypothetical protein
VLVFPVGGLQEEKSQLDQQRFEQFLLDLRGRASQLLAWLAPPNLPWFAGFFTATLLQVMTILRSGGMDPTSRIQIPL